MKHLIIILAILLGSFTGFAEVKREGDTFRIEKTATNDTQTKYKWQDKEGNKYPVFMTKNGSYYVKRVSKKTGKEYKYYLPKEIQEVIKKEFNI